MTASAVQSWYCPASDAANVVQEADTPTVIIENVPAGSVLKDLGFFCQDEAEQSVTNGMPGKVQLSWSRGSKNVVLEEGVVCLPNMPVSPVLQLSFAAFWLHPHTVHCA